MKKITYFFFLVLIAGCSLGSKSPKAIYTYTVDLKDLENDQAVITLDVSGLDEDTVDFVMAAYTPGFYEQLHNATLVTEVKASAEDGSNLPVIKADDNRWRIPNASSLTTITYRIDDVEEVREDVSASLPHENLFERGKGFQFIPAASFGYLDNVQTDSISINVTKPFGLSVFSAREKVTSEGQQLVYSASSIPELFKYPLLFTNQQSESFEELNTTIDVAWYSEDENLSSDQFLPAIQQAIKDVSAYMDIDFPAAYYSFQLWFLADQNLTEISSSHYNSSSVWVIPADRDFLKQESIQQAIYEQAVREFMHIYVSQYAQSWEMRAFDYGSPTPTKHLWYVEGTTEYLTKHMQVNKRKMSEAEFRDIINAKLRETKSYQAEKPLTELSRDIFDDPEGDVLSVIKGRGFFVSMILDIKLRSSSYGQRGLKQMIQVLAREYGADKSFYDGELFEIMANYTNQDLNAVYEQYVADTEPLPLQNIFNRVGYNFNTEQLEIIKDPYPGVDAVELQLSWLFGK
ncbi:MAG: hypothetical protein FH748_07425 [Balneolaceae bacterium]|nr:hypothetical protein [Balneolaceae bacterium]